MCKADREVRPIFFNKTHYLHCTTTALEAEHDELLQETQVVSDMVQQCIYENAHVALDQAEYQKRYDALTQRFDKAKARLEEVTEEISQKQTQRANYEAFLKAFERLPDQAA